MLDYHLLEALEAVVETGSFHRAASKLHLTQSAISQRIATLEEFLGAPVVLRETPSLPTRIGIQLIHHLREVKLKEQELGIVSTQRSEEWAEITLGANADSAATWFFSAITPELFKRRLLLKLLVETDVLVHDLIQRGEAQGCVMGRDKALPGCDIKYLGAMAYTCVCTPQFKERWFKNGFSKLSVKTTPSVLFDRYDTMHHKFLQKYFNLRRPTFPHHTVNSASGFLSLIQAGLAYGMLPKLQIKEDLKNKTLIELAPKTIIEHDLYWIYPRRGAKTFETLWSALQEAASRVLE